MFNIRVITLADYDATIELIRREGRRRLTGDVRRAPTETETARPLELKPTGH